MFQESDRIDVHNARQRLVMVENDDADHATMRDRFSVEQ